MDISYLAEVLTLMAKEAKDNQPSGKEQQAIAGGSHCVYKMGSAREDSRALTLSSIVCIQYHVPWDLKHWEIGVVPYIISKMASKVP